MRIAINATSIGQHFDGVTTATEAMIDSLRVNGREVFLYSSALRFAGLEGVTFRPTPASLAFKGSWLSNLRRFWWLQTSFPSILRRDGIQLLINPGVEGVLWPSVPQVMTVHDILPLTHRNESPRYHYYYRYILPMLLREARLVLAVSEFTRQEVIRSLHVPPEKVVVAPGGLPNRYFEAAVDTGPSPTKPPFFLFVGTFSPRKNLRTVLWAFAKVSNEITENLVVVAYPDRWQRGIAQLAGELGISERVTYRSNLSSEELIRLYRGATAVVLVSEYEGFGLPPLEAMALGTPAIVSDTTSLAEVVGDAAYKLSYDDVNAVGCAMLRLSTDRERRREMIELGRKQAAKFNRARSIERLNRALEPLLDVRPSNGARK